MKTGIKTDMKSGGQKIEGARSEGDKSLYALELIIAKILRYGVLGAGFFMLAGWVSQIQFNGNPFVGFHDYRHMPMQEVLSGLFRDHNYGLLTSYFGLLILVTLPFIRVVMTMLLFLKQREFLLAGIALFVASALLISFSLGFAI
jgi:uncharacterized membrane protein